VTEVFFKLVNAARQTAGLQPLTWNPKLAAVAEAHAKDMLSNNYYSHVSRDGAVPAIRVRKAGITFQRMAETVAQGQTPEVVYGQFKGSANHWAEMMSPNFSEAGFALVPGGQWGLMAVGLYIKPRPIKAEPMPQPQYEVNMKP
jgi:uncharacterized protein YkwD